MTNSMCLSVDSNFFPFLFLDRFSLLIGTAHSKPLNHQIQPEMSHPGQQPSDYYQVDSTNDYANFGDERRPKRRSRNTTDNRQDPSVGQHTYTHQQPPSQNWCAPQTAEFGPTSLDFRPANSANQAYPSFGAWSNVPPQDRYQNPTGNTFQLPDNGNSLHPVGMPEYGNNWTDEQLLQSLLDWDAPVIGDPQFVSPYDYGQSAADETDWFTPGRAPRPDVMNQVPFQPTRPAYGIDRAPVPGPYSYHQPMSYAPIGASTTKEIGCTPPNQTSDGNYSGQGSANYSQTPQDGQRTESADASDHGPRPALSIAAHQRAHDDASLLVSNATRHPKFLPVLQVTSHPIIDGASRPGDNLPPRNLTKRIMKPPQDFLSQALTTNFSRTSMKFLDSRPDCHDVSKIPIGTLASCFLIMGVFDRKLCMSYVHGNSARRPDPVERLSFCDANEKTMGDWLSRHGNDVISLIQNCRRWTAVLLRSTWERSNGFVTLSSMEVPHEYAYGDDEKASLCVAAAALSAYSNTKFRPVFDKEEYDRIRTGAKPILAKPASFLPSGVMNSSPEELSRLSQVPPGWGNTRLPDLQIAGQWVLDGAQVMGVGSG